MNAWQQLHRIEQEVAMMRSSGIMFTLVLLEVLDVWVDGWLDRWMDGY